MSNTDLTEYPKRYLYAPLNNPQISQKIYTCVEDGSLVYDLLAHDEFHKRLEALEKGEPDAINDPNNAQEVTTSAPKQPSSTSRSTAKSVKVTEESDAASGS